MKDLLIAALLALIVVLKLVDVIADMGLQLPPDHLIQEWLLLMLSAGGCVYLIGDIRRRSKALRSLRDNLTTREADLASLSARLRDARRAYAETIRAQFEAWNLTRSEQQVAMLLLKGLSLQEIAAVRDTREKTVRQHASNVYAKAGIEGRHALSAWFLEDLMTEQTATGAEGAAAGESRVPG
ncbi:MAG: LuxR C-terminal-related transcriptional regulator [Halieaceae bacterium]|jgi:DNA-binding CsgD family transcriptional regulator|nr:LuxR C-terminal-related transcriptional regulator [Halieaceae bacterium]